MAVTKIKLGYRFILYLMLNMAVLAMSANLHGQIVDKNPNVFLSRSNGLIPEAIPLPREGGTEVKIFLEEDWYMGDVKSYEDEFIINKPLKYEIIRNRLEIQFNDETMGLNQYHVKSFEWFNVKENRRAVFLNCKDLLFKEDQLGGFLEILTEGKVTLSSHKTVKYIQGSDVLPASGNYQKEEIFLKEHFYYSKDGGPITLFPQKRKDILKVFQGKREMVRQFVKDNDLTFELKEDLTKICGFYNLLSVQDSLKR